MPNYNKIIVNADGGSRGNPGPAAIGVVLSSGNRRVIERYKECIGAATNNVAEYKSLIKALELAAKYTTGKVEVIMDSELVVRQVTGIYRVKKAHLVPLYDEVKKKAAVFEKVTYSSVPRDDQYQSEADRLVNDALDELY